MSLARLLLLSCCAALGVGIALAVGFSAGPPQSPQKGVERQAGSWELEAASRRLGAGSQTPESGSRERGAGTLARYAGDGQLPSDRAEQAAVEEQPQPIAASAEQPEQQGQPGHPKNPASTLESEPASADGSAPSRLVVPRGAISAEPNPLVGAEVVPPADGERFQKALDYLRQQLGPASAPLPPETVPTPAPAIRLVNPLDPQPIPQSRTPAAVTTPRADPRDLPPTAQARQRITRSMDGEGDDKLAIRIQDADIREVLEMLSEQGNLNILASNRVQGKVSATLKDVDIDSALDAILRSTGFVARREGKFIYVGTPEDFDGMEQLLDTVGTRVYRPNYLSATDLQTLVEPLLTPKVGVSSISAPSEVGIGTDDEQAGGNRFAGVDVVLVRDYEAVLAQVDQVVAEVDVRPMQVAIEAMILSVRLADSDKFGVNFELLRDHGNVGMGWGEPLGNLADLRFTEGGLKFGFLDSSVGAFLDALETVGDTNVIATPRLMVLNKHRADILIGKEEGYVSTTQTETARTQSVEFLEIGAQLRIRPFISRDGLVRMEVHPELSDGSVRELAGFTVPRKDVTKVTTNIMVRDGCTVVIGGLMREQLETTTKQVPLLGNLPVVGAAFRNIDAKVIREEVIVLITPRIVYEPESCIEGQNVACEFQRRQDVYASKMSPLGKRSIGRRYYRLAQQAWQCGDCERARRFADLAVHFDPLSLEIIDLRNQIWAGKSGDCRTIRQPAVAATPDFPAGALAPPASAIESASDPSPAIAQPLHPRDPGIPGTHREILRPDRLP